MLETPKASSEGLDDDTMDNQQETNGFIVILVGSLETTRDTSLMDEEIVLTT
jgi:hypothetical protein